MRLSGSDVILVLATATVVGGAGWFVRQAVRSDGTSDIVLRLSAERFDALRSEGQSVGAAESRIVVFSDFQCEFCRQLHGNLDSLMASDPTLGVRYRHFPLAQNPRAFSAARASECAGEQGRFAAFAASVFSVQDSLGRHDMQALLNATDGVDAARAVRCLESDGPATRIRRDVDAGVALGITGTPLLVVDGHVVRGYVPADSIRRILAASAR